MQCGWHSTRCSLFRGRIAIAQIEAEDIALDTALAAVRKAPQAGRPVASTNSRSAMEAAFRSSSTSIDSFVERSGTRSVKLEVSTSSLPIRPTGRCAIVIDSLVLEDTAGRAAARRRGRHQRQNGDLSVTSQKVRRAYLKLTGQVTGADLAPFTLKRNTLGQIRQGIDGFCGPHESRRFVPENPKPSLAAAIDLKPGSSIWTATQQERAAAASTSPMISSSIRSRSPTPQLSSAHVCSR